MNVARGKNISDALLNSARTQLPGGPAAQAAFDAAVALAKGKNIQDAAFAAAGKLLPPSPYAADALSFVKKVASGENIQKAALSSLGNMVMSRIEKQAGPVLSNVRGHIPQLPRGLNASAINSALGTRSIPANLPRLGMQHESGGPWIQAPRGALWLPAPTRMESGYENSFGTQQDSKAVRITIVGHASARWRGARNVTEANRLNEILSNKRAENIRSVVEQILRREVPGVRIAAGSSLAPGQHPTGIQVGSYGVGSREPVLNPAPAKIDPGENNPVNRSVVLLLELTTTKHSSAGVSRPPLRVGARTKFWYGKVLNFKGSAIGAAAYFFRLAIRNSVSNKVATYTGRLLGGGISSGVHLPTSSRPGVVGDEFSFATEKEMGFVDFNGNFVRIEKVGAKLGIKADVTYLTFLGLGKGAALLAFEKGFGFGLGKPALDGVVVSGAIHMEGPDPGDWFEVDGGTDSVPVSSDKVQNDGLIVTFPTGKAGVNDLAPEDRRKLETFVVSWARQVR
jgi:hypothetical protein